MYPAQAILIFSTNLLFQTTSNQSITSSLIIYPLIWYIIVSFIGSSTLGTVFHLNITCGGTFTPSANTINSKVTHISSLSDNMWCTGSMQELLSHRGLGARAQRESCGYYRRIARRQVCERLDCATGSAGNVTHPNHPVTTIALTLTQFTI
jgi:hypothetical protein